MTMTITETMVEERLKPQIIACNPEKKATKHPVPYSLMRSASFYRLRQFPTYFCQHGSAEIYRWIYSSKTKLATISQVAKQLQQILLVAAVYGAIGLLGIQLFAIMATVATVPLPLGLNFLLSCVAMMATLATAILLPQTQVRKSRSLNRSRH